MIALAILAVGLVSLYTAQGNSLRASATAERMQVGAMLAREKMTEKMMEIEQGLVKGAFPEDKEEETGTFDPPFDDYRWEYTVRKVEIPIAGAGDSQGEGEGGAGGDPRASENNQAPASAQANVAKVVSKKIAESVREINVRVIWGEFEDEESIKVTSHVSKL